MFGKNRDRLMRAVSVIVGALMILSLIFSYFIYTV